MRIRNPRQGGNFEHSLNGYRFVDISRARNTRGLLRKRQKNGGLANSNYWVNKLAALAKQASAKGLLRHAAMWQLKTTADFCRPVGHFSLLHRGSNKVLIY